MTALKFAQILIPFPMHPKLNLNPQLKTMCIFRRMLSNLAVSTTGKLAFWSSVT